MASYDSFDEIHQPTNDVSLIKYNAYSCGQNCL